MTNAQQPVGNGDTSSWGIVRRRLRRDRVAWIGVRCVVLLFLVATLAPVISLNQPFILVRSEGTEFPWLRALFNRLLFENGVDLLFNMLLVAGPVLFVSWLLVRRLSVSGQRQKAFLRGAVLVFLTAFFACNVPSIGTWENPLFFTERVQNYRELVEKAADGDGAPLAVFPPNPYSYRETNPQESLEPPSLRHWLGTDTEGRDVFARMLYGTRISLTIGVVAVMLYVSIGVLLGALAGYFGGMVDNLISRAIEVMITFPSFFLILTLAAMVEERSIFHVMVIIGLTRWTQVARLIRAEFLQQKGLEYVQAAVAAGLSQRRIIFGHILPNAISPALVSATFGIASAILIESSLSFLGVGDASVASWGETLSTGRTQGKLWLILAPGAAIFVVVTVFNLVGEGVRDALDPKLRTS